MQENSDILMDSKFKEKIFKKDKNKKNSISI